jgi:hypothetical protein
VPGSDVIASVSETLQGVLNNAVGALDNPPPTAELSNLHGSISTTPARLTIFLFEVAEDASARNKPRIRTASAPNILTAKPPMALLLRYLITAWGGDRATEHRLLGRAMQVLYDGALISGSDLQGGALKDTAEVLKVTLLPLTLEERTRVWHSVQRPYRLSLYYEIRVVNLDSETADQRSMVVGRDFGYGMGVAAP